MCTAVKMARQCLTWIVLCQLVLCVISAQDGKGIKWEPSEDLTIQQGKPLTLKCVAENVHMLGIVRIARKNPATGHEDTITDNADLKRNFLITGRYNITMLEDGSKITLVLQYSAMRGEDMGELQCFILGKQSSGAKLLLEVLVPVEDVYLMMKVDDQPEVELPDNSVAYLRHGQQSMLKCVVTRDGTIRPPTVDIFIGGNNEYHSFVRKDFPRSIKPNGKPAHESLKMEFTMDTMTPSMEYHDKNLTCVGSAKNYDDVIASVRLDVEFSPVITCHKYEWFGQLGKPLTIKCDVHSNPGSSLTWLYGPDRDTATQIDTITDEKDGVFVHKEEPFSQSHTHIKLTITSLNVSHLTNFYLSAKNDIDTKEVTVTVSEGMMDVEVQPKPNNPNYSIKNKPSKRGRPRDPQRVRSRGSASTLCVSAVSFIMSLILSSSLHR